MVSVALTGNVASGKSVVAGVLEAGGVPVLRADDLARRAVSPGSPGLEDVRRAFGPDVLDEGGGLDRARMRRIAFSDPAARERLERLLHPHVRRMRGDWMARRRAEGAVVVVTEIPILFEMRLEDEFDAVVVVHSSNAERERRLVEDRGLDLSEARALMAAQGDPDVKLARADRIISNDGTLAELEDRARALCDDLVAGRFP